MLAPIEAKPAHVVLDGVDIFLILPGRIGVVVAQIALAAEFLRDAKIQADRLGVTDVQIAVRLRREAGNDFFMPAGGQVGANDFADEILTRFPYRRFRNRHDLIASRLPQSKPAARPDWTNWPARSSPQAGNRNSLTSFAVQLCYMSRVGRIRP